MAKLTEQHEQLATESQWDFSDLRALFINCTLKRSPEVSNTSGLAGLAVAIMERNGVSVEVIRAVDHQIATGVYPDMTEHGWDRDDWPAIFEKVIAADILVVLSPIWLGEKSSVCTQVIERLYGNSHLLNDAGQWAYYGRVGGCIITGNEDGAKHCAMNILYSLQHLGYVIPPQADSAWLGEAGPGPSYLDPGSGGPENDFTNRNTTFLAWNVALAIANAQARETLVLQAATDPVTGLANHRKFHERLNSEVERASRHRLVLREPRPVRS
jgi:multimeric flavodoxin WrbA